jgi:hypothetical protein
VRTNGEASPSLSVEPRQIHESVRLTLCFGVRLVKEFALLNSCALRRFCVSFPAIRLLISNSLVTLRSFENVATNYITELTETAKLFTNSLSKRNCSYESCSVSKVS